MFTPFDNVDELDAVELVGGEGVSGFDHPQEGDQGIVITWPLWKLCALTSALLVLSVLCHCS